MIVFNKIENVLRDLISVVSFEIEKIVSNLSPKRIIAHRLFDFCEDCETMASIPQGAFAACKMSSFNKNDMTIAKMRPSNEKPDMKNNVTNKKLLEYSPVKYNSKLMNAIWGHYNRYSPHNIKGNEYEVEAHKFNMQQPMAVASYAIEKKLSMASNGNEWNFP